MVLVVERRRFGPVISRFIEVGAATIDSNKREKGIIAAASERLLGGGLGWCG